MYRPSQTPHLLLLDTWITSQACLIQIAVPVRGLIPRYIRSKKTFKVGVFQVRFRSSLRYTSKVFSQK
jgi:hypothetical protein